MSDPTPAPGRLRDAATFVSSLLIPVPILMSGFVKAILFAGNPAGVDLTSDLAYLREILLSGFVSLGVVLVVIVVLIVLAYRRGRSFASVRLPLAILGVQILLGVVILVFSALSDNAVDTYVG